MNIDIDIDIPKSERLPLAFTLAIQVVLVLGAIVFVVRRDWENFFLTLTVIALTVVPAYVLRQYRIHIPPEFQLIAAAFVFVSFFLGSASDFYYKFWWWDLVLHTSSGFLLGIVGWITLFLLNSTDRLPRGIRPSFLCFFAVTFAISLGVVWEIFEFAVDSIWPNVNMMSTETGKGERGIDAVADTMHDLIVNIIGAVAVALMGWAYYKKGKYSFLADAVRAFVKKNPRLFRKKKSKE